MKGWSPESAHSGNILYSKSVQWLWIFSWRKAEYKNKIKTRLDRKSFTNLEINCNSVRVFLDDSRQSYGLVQLDSPPYCWIVSSLRHVSEGKVVALCLTAASWPQGLSQHSGLVVAQIIFRLWKTVRDFGLGQWLGSSHRRFIKAGLMRPLHSGSACAARNGPTLDKLKFVLSWKQPMEALSMTYVEKKQKDHIKKKLL